MKRDYPRCRTCKHWESWGSHGTCLLADHYHVGGELDPKATDSFVTQTIHGGDDHAEPALYVGADFGCVHHAAGT